MGGGGGGWGEGKKKERNKTGYSIRVLLGHPNKELNQIAKIFFPVGWRGIGGEEGAGVR